MIHHHICNEYIPLNRRTQCWHTANSSSIKYQTYKILINTFISETLWFRPLGFYKVVFTGGAITHTVPSFFGAGRARRGDTRGSTTPSTSSTPPPS